MASSFVVDLIGKPNDEERTPSTPDKRTIGYLEFLELDKTKTDQEGKNGSRPRWKVLITLEEDNNKLCRQLWEKVQKEGNRLPIAGFRALPERLTPLKGRVWLKTNGKLCYDLPKVYLNERSRSKWAIFQGYYEYDIPVAIQEVRLASTTMTEIEREFQILRQLENHENFIRYFCHEEDASTCFVYIATELCACSVADLYEPKTDEHTVKSQDILQTLRPKTILFQATRGLEYLHSHGYVHRNVKPSSFLIKEVISPIKGCSQYVIKITDFRLSRNSLYGGELSGTVASDEWGAPESRRLRQTLKPSLDVFILGCFFHFVIVADERRQKNTNEVNSSLHPFGNSWGKIINQNYEVYQPSWKPAIADEAAITLIKSMLKFDESKRPPLSQVLEHPFFQTPMSKEFYPIYSYDKPGWCVIFNQEKFKKPDGTDHHRVGSQEDCQRLKETFGGLGYYVEVFHNSTSIELKSTIKELASKVDLTGYGSLVVCLLSHGFEGYILCSDNVPVNINRLKSKFSLKKCPHLYGKPKIFIVQACQVSLDSSERTLLRGGNIEMENLTLSVGKHRGLGQRVRGIFGKTPKPKFNLQKTPEGPPLLDFLTIFATLPGSLACRNRKGSYFIQALCDALSDEYLSSEGNDSMEKRDLESVLRVDGGVQDLISRSYTETDKTWQTMQWEACLTKYIRFKDCGTEKFAAQPKKKKPKRGFINRNSFATEYDSFAMVAFSRSRFTIIQIFFVVFFVILSCLISLLYYM